MGGNHACASGPSGTVYCWGNHQYGEVGSAATADAYSPAAVSGLTGVVALALGGMSSCALLSDATVSCWGRNSLGELGQGAADDNDHAAPAPVPGLSDVVQIALSSSGDGEHVCAVKTDGSVLCWGANHAGQLGLGTSDDDPHPTPAAVAGVAGVKQDSSRRRDDLRRRGRRHGSAKVNDNAELGKDPATSETCPGGGIPFACETHPKQVAGVTTGAKVAAGYFSTHVLLADGTVTGWGANTDGVLGTGDATFSIQATPQAVPGLTDVVDLAASGSLSSDAVCAVKKDGTVWCWGSNQLYEQGTRRGVRQRPPRTASSR